LGVASALAAMRADLPGTVKFVFQPGEEGHYKPIATHSTSTPALKSRWAIVSIN
jgi:metal-dependent amidase/aminoacylase/carboxypeptidase family protein